VTSLLNARIPATFSSDKAFATFRKAECDFLNKGTSRDVFWIRGTEYVLKVARNKRNHAICNWTEISAFFCYAADQQKLARIISWSTSGKFLVMEKLSIRATESDSFVYPSWVTDRKLSNIGVDAHGRTKICDYAMVTPPDNTYKSPFA
jgi:hypothetical protein